MVSLMKANDRDVLVETAKLSTEEWTEDPPFQPDIREAPGTNGANTPVWIPWCLCLLLLKLFTYC